MLLEFKDISYQYPGSGNDVFKNLTCKISSPGFHALFGPSGVGKTELAKALAEFMFDDEDALVRLIEPAYVDSVANDWQFGEWWLLVGTDSCRTDIDDDINIQYTSGTTGMPKGIQFSQRNLVFKAGPGAFDLIRRHGFAPELIGTIAGASGGGTADRCQRSSPSAARNLRCRTGRPLRGPLPST